MDRPFRSSLMIMALTLLGLVGAAPLAADPCVFIGPIPYLSKADSPFDLSAPQSWLEDFEDGALNVPGVTASSGFVVQPGPLADSVDADDGLIDGFGNRGHSYNQGTTQGGSLSLTFFFDSAILGAFPSHAGLVWTDDRAYVTFEAWDSDGAYLGGVGPFLLGDEEYDTTGPTGEDRFFGAIHNDGISRITVTHVGRGLEIDHLQYTVPGVVAEPFSAAFLGSALVAVIAHRLGKRRDEAKR